MIVKIKLKVYVLLISLLWRNSMTCFSRNFYYFLFISMSCTYNGFTQEVIKANIIVAKDGTFEC
jgi:hypothetical protein